MENNNMYTQMELDIEARALNHYLKKFAEKIDVSDADFVINKKDVIQTFWSDYFNDKPLFG